jgi:hypothetical protein
MPLVFVHGVSVRKDENYGVNEEARDGLFRKYALTAISSDSSQIAFENPYWGGFGGEGSGQRRHGAAVLCLMANMKTSARPTASSKKF